MQLKPFQLDDLARAACHDGLVLGWATGLGKTLAGFLWPLLKCGVESKPQKPAEPSAADLKPPTLVPNGRVLLVIPGDLHKKTIEAAWQQLRIRLTPLDSQEAFLCAQSGSLDGKSLPHGFYLTSYTQLATNGVDKMPDPEKVSPRVLLDWFCQPVALAEELYLQRADVWRRDYECLQVDPYGTMAGLDYEYQLRLEELGTWADRKAADKKRARYNEAHDVLRHLFPTGNRPSLWANLGPSQQDFVIREFNRRWIRECSDNMGRLKPGAKPGTSAEESPNESGAIRCVFSPSLADLGWDAFDCVVVDEGVKMKGADTLVGQGVRKMAPRYRLVLTATPIKNRLKDLFWLVWWATGGKADAHARWPYGGTEGDQEDFGDTFLVSERNLTKEQNSDTKRRYEKLTAEVCNVHKLWKLLAPNVLRRRKQDTRQVIVPKIRNVVRVPMGKHQARVYEHHLKGTYIDRNFMPAPGAKLQALRVVAADPTSTLLGPHPSGQNRELPARSAYRSTPKMAAVLNLVDQILRRGEQAVIFSAFHDPLDRLSGFLREAGVPHEVLDGRTSQKRRGERAYAFMQGKSSGIPLLLAGVECMAEGHDFSLCNNAILMSYSWAYDRFEQAINRVHRMTSPKPVNIYAVICDGSIDRKLEALIQEKGEACELVLDGKLLGERSEEVNLAQLLSIAETEFASVDGAPFQDEAEIGRAWPALKERLTTAMARWQIEDRVEPEGKPQGTGSDNPKSETAFDEVPEWLRLAQDFLG